MPAQNLVCMCLTLLQWNINKQINSMTLQERYKSLWRHQVVVHLVCTQYGVGCCLILQSALQRVPCRALSSFPTSKRQIWWQPSSQKTESPASLPVCKSSTYSGMTLLSHVRLAALKLGQTLKFFLCGLVLWC
jgi:hypothetical protein